MKPIFVGFGKAGKVREATTITAQALLGRSRRSCSSEQQDPEPAAVFSWKLELPRSTYVAASAQQRTRSKTVARGAAGAAHRCSCCCSGCSQLPTLQQGPSSLLELQYHGMNLLKQESSRKRTQRRKDCKTKGIAQGHITPQAPGPPHYGANKNISSSSTC